MRGVSVKRRLNFAVAVATVAQRDATMPSSIGEYVGRYCDPPQLPPLAAAPADIALTPAELAAAAPTAADPAMRCFARRLEAQDASRPLRIAMFGTSVTAGNRCRAHGANFPQLLLQLLGRRAPAANLTLDVYSYPGASPTFMRSCFRTLLPAASADLYVVEMTDNLAGAAASGGDLEQLLAAMRRRAPHAAVVLLTPIDQTCVRGLKRMKPFAAVPRDAAGTAQILERCYSNATVSAAFEAVGRAHNISVVSGRLAVRDRLRAAPDGATAYVGRLVHDSAHPGRYGHLQLALALERAIVAHFRAAEVPPRPPRPPGREPHACAAARRARGGGGGGGWAYGSNVFASRVAPAAGAEPLQVCALGPSLRPYVTRASGWEYTVERNSQGVEKPGYVARAAGAALELCYRPPPPSDARLEASARRGVAAVSYAWSLGYLMSYEGMGRARGSCVGGGACTCGARVFDAHWKRLTSQPHISRLQLKYKFVRGGGGGAAWVPAASLAVGGGAGGEGGGGGGAAARCPCVIRLEVLNETSSAGHKWKLVALMSGFYTGTIVGDAVEWAARYGIM